MRLLLFFLSFTSIASAQITPSLTPDFKHDLQVYYFPFYNGTQLIEVDYFGESLARGSWGDAVHPRGGSDYHDAITFDIPNGYILRNEKGEVIEMYGIRNLGSLELLPPNDSITITHKERLNTAKVLRNGGAYTWKDANGYGYRFRNLHKSSEKLERDVYTDGFICILDTLGKVVIQNMSSISHANGEYLVSKNESFAIYDSTFTMTMDYVEGRVTRSAPEKYFHVNESTKIIDRYGKKVDNDKYVKIERIRSSENYIYSSKTVSGIRYGIMRKDLSQLTPPIYKNVFPLTKRKGYSVSNLSGKWALLNESGVRITKFEYERDAFRYYEKGTYTIYNREGGPFRQGMIDTLGNEVIPMIYDQVKAFKNGLAVVSLNGKEGIVNRKGEVQGEIAYSKIVNRYSKHVHVALNGKYGIISHTGEVIVEPIFRSVSCFDSDFLYVSNDQNERFLFDVNTKELTPCEYYQIWCFNEGFFKVSKEGKMGMLDVNMNVVIPLEYDYVSQVLNGTIVVKKGDFYGLYNSKFELIKPLKFKKFRENDSGGYEVY